MNRQKSIYMNAFSISEIFLFVSQTICVKRSKTCESSSNITKIAKNWEDPLKTSKVK